MDADFQLETVSEIIVFDGFLNDFPYLIFECFLAGLIEMKPDKISCIPMCKG